MTATQKQVKRALYNGLPNLSDRELRLMIDRELRDSEYFGCHPCINTSSLRLRTKDLLEVIIPAMGHEPHFVTL